MIDSKPCSRCRRWIHFVNASQNDYQVAKHQKNKTDLFTHVKGLLYKHVINANQIFITLIIPKAWKYTTSVEAHDKLGHQGVTHNYCLIK